MIPFSKVAYYTLGCKLNFSETSSISRDLMEAGYARVDFFDHPDVYVINTCSVTDNADKKCRKLVKDALNHSPKAFVVIIGCYSQLKPKEISEIPGVSLVLGAQEKFNISKYLKNINTGDAVKVINSSIKEIEEFVPAFSNNERTRSFLKVQDGCDYHCSFCTIPLARGKSRSSSVVKIVATANEIVESGIQEIVLTGVNIGDFGNGTDESFFDLLKELNNIKGLNRIRISSIEPNLLTKEIVTLVSNSNKIMPHFHIPLQSGSNEILKAMRRKYDREHYQSKVELIHQLIDNCCIGVDVIVGYPGETEDYFLETFNFLNELNIAYLHVFTYSERDNTTALRSDQVVPMADRTKRRKMLQILSEKKKRKFYSDNISNIQSALFEGENKDGFISGFTNNYIRVKTEFDAKKINTINKIKLISLDEDCVMTGSIVKQEELLTNSYSN
ncbi:MAG: tRNA (N(6)-L-threonylcarbamoyladenosine(37)-C(2))-methylthiotransferase MtaB [Flavobacteriales bacterium]|nr:tRNA (N(6)-L-threonylcarbamoyladenosine(37)-C(2))-methylthiotransferase MtaB [Flavobacteriales bacterium]